MKKRYLLVLLTLMIFNFFGNVFGEQISLENKAFIEQHITIVELKELIRLAREDLKTRAKSLNRSDKAEIIKIIKEKEQGLAKHLEVMEAYLSQELRKMGRGSFSKKIIIIGGVTITIGAFLAIIFS